MIIATIEIEYDTWILHPFYCFCHTHFAFPYPIQTESNFRNNPIFKDEITIFDVSAQSAKLVHHRTILYLSLYTVDDASSVGVNKVIPYIVIRSNSVIEKGARAIVAMDVIYHQHNSFHIFLFCEYQLCCVGRWHFQFAISLHRATSSFCLHYTAGSLSPISICL